MKLRIRPWLRTLDRIPTGFWIVLLVVPALVPLARPGLFQSHDGLWHAERLAALARAVRAGVIYPRWFPEFAFGYGHPVLNFYGPAGYYLGLPFLLVGLETAQALKLVFALSLLASAGSMYLFARLHLARGPALVAAIVYAYMPYHLADLYVRGAIAELVAFVWFPLILWACHRLVEDTRRVSLDRIGLAAISLAALVTTHSLSVLLIAPVLAGYILILLIRRRTLKAVTAAVARLALAGGLALALSAFYWLPVQAESRYVGLATGVSQGYRNHLLAPANLISAGAAYTYPGQADPVIVFPIALIEVILLVAGTTLLLARRPRKWPLAFFLGVGLTFFFMLTTVSLPVWKALERVLAFLQYPWRLQTLTALTGAFLAGALVNGVPGNSRTGAHSVGRLACGGSILLAVGLAALWKLPVMPAIEDLTVERMWQIDHDMGQVGTTWTGEFLPVWVKEQRWALSQPVSPAAPSPRYQTAGLARLAAAGYTRYSFEMDTSEAMTVVLHQFYYPGWQAHWQGQTLAARPDGLLGLAAFDLTAGSGLLQLSLDSTPAQFWGTLVSLLAWLLASVGLLVSSRRRLRPPVAAYPEPCPPVPAALPRVATAAAAVAGLCIAAVLAVNLIRPHGRAVPVIPVGANLEDKVELLGYRVDGARYRPGEAVTVTLYWLALRGLGTDYKAFVHLTDAGLTRQPAQHDGDPGSGYSPTTRWEPGELVPDGHRLVLPAGLPPGRYRLWAGLYEYPAIRNLSVLSTQTETGDGRVLLGEIEVVAP